MSTFIRFTLEKTAHGSRLVADGETPRFDLYLLLIGYVVAATALTFIFSGRVFVFLMLGFTALYLRKRALIYAERVAPRRSMFPRISTSIEMNIDAVDTDSESPYRAEPTTQKLAKLVIDEQELSCDRLEAIRLVKWPSKLTTLIIVVRGANGQQVPYEIDTFASTKAAVAARDTLCALSAERPKPSLRLGKETQETVNIVNYNMWFGVSNLVVLALCNWSAFVFADSPSWAPKAHLMCCLALVPLNMSLLHWLVRRETQRRNALATRLLKSPYRFNIT